LKDDFISFYVHYNKIWYDYDALLTAIKDREKTEYYDLQQNINYYYLPDNNLLYNYYAIT